MIAIHDSRQLDLTRWIGPGDALVCSQIHAEPVTLTRRLIEQRAAIGPFSLFIGPTIADTFAPEHGDFITFHSYCGTARNARLSEDGALDPVPSHYSDYPRLFASGAMRSDVVLLALTPPDPNGRFNLGVCNDYVVDAARRARTVIAEIMPRMPWVHGAELPDDIRPDVLVHGNVEPALMPETGEGTSQELAIAKRVAALVPDGATLALGVAGVEIDLTGQINAESAGGRYIGAVGGQGDFLRGANLSVGGGSIMMLAATARGGRTSRIVARLADAVVTTPRSDVQQVVTEFGSADLRGKSLRQRVQALLPLAHPDFREQLDRDAQALFGR